MCCSEVCGQEPIYLLASFRGIKQLMNALSQCIITCDDNEILISPM